VAGVNITTAFTNMTLEADEVNVLITSAKSVLESLLEIAGYDAVVVFVAAVTIADPTATPTPSPTFTIATVDSKTGGTNSVLDISDNIYASNSNLRFY
jgi:ribosomal protein S3AE